MGARSAWASQQARARLGRYILALTIPVSALCLGALHTPVLALCAAMGALGTGLLWFDAEPLEPRPAATVLALVGALLVLWTFVQILPLPRGLLGAIAGENADVWQRALTPFRQDGPTFATLSLDPTASRVQMLRGITYLTIFVGAVRMARRREGIVLVERVILASSVAVAAAALMHPVLGARKVFGVYEPTEPFGYPLHYISPLLNVNHLAAYCNLGAMVAFSCAVERRAAVPRPLGVVIALLLGATTVWTTSRGGVATLILGVILVPTLSVAARRAKLVRAATQFTVIGIATGGVVVLMLAAFDGFREKVARGDLSKIDLVRNALDLARSHPIFGVGRGAFESTFPKVRVGTNWWVFTHPENVVAQWVTEWGIPVALGAFVAMAWALRPKTALARSRPPVGPWVALVVVALHNLCDFSSEVPGVVVALVFCAALVTGGSGGGTPAPHRGSRWARRPSVLALGLSAATLLLIGVTLPFGDRELYNEERSMRDLGVDRNVPRPVFDARLKAAMLRHPAEPYFPYVGAVRATVSRDDSVVPWAARALERSPVYGRAHLLLARSLFARNRSQARLEYRTACVQDGGYCEIEEVLPLATSFDDAMELVPDGVAGLPTLSFLAKRLEARLPSTVARLDRELLRRDPTLLPPVERTAARALGDVTGEEAWCVEPEGGGGGRRAACIAAGLEAAGRLRAFAPEKCEGHALTAELRVAAGEIEQGYAELDRSLDQVDDRSACARRMVSLAVQIGNNARLDAAIDRLLKLGCESPTACVANYTFVADIEERRGAHRHAVALAKKAWEAVPERDDLLIDLATKAEREGVHRDALDAYMRLMERHPEEKKWADGAGREREALTRRMFERK